jgi:cell division protein FtsN
MAKDYKHSGRAPAKKRSGPSGGLMLTIGLFAGLIIGVVIGLGVVATRTYVEIRQQLEQDLTASAHPQARGDERGPSADNRPRFEFYKILPEMEVVVPDEEARQLTAPKPSKPAVTAAAKERYLLQVASFQNHSDADRLKAQLALLGVEAAIQTVEIKGGETWHRVRVGPFNDQDTLASTRERLQSNGIESILLKLSG